MTTPQASTAAPVKCKRPVASNAPHSNPPDPGPTTRVHIYNYDHCTRHPSTDGSNAEPKASQTPNDMSAPSPPGRSIPLRVLPSLPLPLLSGVQPFNLFAVFPNPRIHPRLHHWHPRPPRRAALLPRWGRHRWRYTRPQGMTMDIRIGMGNVSK